MLVFIKKVFIRLLSASTTGSVGESLTSKSKGLIKCVSLSKRPCYARPTLVNRNPNEPLYYLFTVSVNKCCGSCNIIDNPHVRVCVSDKVKNINVRVFYSVSRIR